MSISRGAIQRIKQGENFPNAVLQVLTIKPVVTSAGAGATQRYRILLTDGVEEIPAMLATQHNDRVVSGLIREFTVVSVTKFMSNDLNGQRIMIILDFDVVNQLQESVAGARPQVGAAVPAPVATPYGAPAAPYHQQPPQQQQQQQQQQQRPPEASVYGQPQNAYHQQPPVAAPVYGHITNQPPAAPYGTAGQPNNYGNRPAAAPGGYSAASTSYGAGASSYGGANKPVYRDDSADSNIVPISALSPYSNKWTIKARITAKTDVKSWKNDRGEGTLFSIDLLDSAGGEIRATFYKESCAKYFPMLEEGKVYTFSGGRTKLVQNRQFSHLKNSYELSFDLGSDIRPSTEDPHIRTQNYAFVPINDLASIDVSNQSAATVDILAIVRSASDVSEIISQKMGGKTLQKRDLTLIDSSNTEVRLTLWGEKALANYDWNAGPIVAFKGVKVGDYGGRSLGMLNSSSMSINPMIPEAFQLNTWRSQFQNGIIPAANSLSGGGAGAGGAGGGLNSMDPLERRKFVGSIKDDGIGMGDKPDYFTVKGSLSYVKKDSDPWYTACPKCNKKVMESMGGKWTCEKCNCEYDKCDRRYILNTTISDHTGNSWFTFFNDTAEKVLGKSAQDLYEMKLENEAGYERVFQDALFKTYLFKVRAKTERVNEDDRLKCAVASIAEIDYISESRQLIDAISKY